MKKVTLSQFGRYAANEATGTASNLGASALLGLHKTLKESTWQTKALGMSLVGNAISGFFDIDMPFDMLGLDSMVGIDEAVNQVSDLVGMAGAASLAYNTYENARKLYNSDKTMDDALKELGIEIDVDLSNEEETKPQIPTPTQGYTKEQVQELINAALEKQRQAFITQMNNKKLEEETKEEKPTEDKETKK